MESVEYTKKTKKRKPDIYRTLVINQTTRRNWLDASHARSNVFPSVMYSINKKNNPFRPV